MRLFWEWLGYLGRMAAAWPAGSTRQALVVERLEPRQMLAADCFFMVEVHRAELDSGASYEDASYETGAFIEGSVDDSPYEDSGSDVPWNAAEPEVSELGGSVLDDIGDYYLIYLEEILDDIGQIWEVKDTAFGAFDDLNFSWFS